MEDNKIVGRFFSSFLTIFAFIVFQSLSLPAQVMAETNASWQEMTRDMEYSSSEIEKVAMECWHYDKLFPSVTKSLRLSRNQCYLESKIEWKGIQFGMYWMKITVEKQWSSADGKTSFFRVYKTDGNVKHFEAEGKLIKLSDNRSRATLRIKGDPGLPGVPTSIIEDGVYDTMKRFYKRLLRRLEKGDYNSFVNL